MRGIFFGDRKRRDLDNLKDHPMVQGLEEEMARYDEFRAYAKRRQAYSKQEEANLLKYESVDLITFIGLFSGVNRNWSEFMAENIVKSITTSDLVNLENRRQSIPNERTEPKLGC